MTQKGRNGPKQSGSTKRPKRVRFAIPLLPYEARELLAEARRMTETVASSNAAEAEEAVDDAASETDEDAPTAQHDSVHPEADGTDEYALYEEAAAAVEESVDPKVNVIQRLALRAASDPGLRALMRLVASRRASRHQLSELQQHINEIDETDNDAADSEHSDVEIAATGMEEDSSHEPEMDDKENVGPTSSQGFGAHRPSGPSTNTDYSIDRGGPQPRSALRLLPVVAPTNRPSNPPTAAAATPGARAPSGPRRESEASLNNRVRNSVHLQNAQRLRGEADAMAERARQHPADGTPERRPSQNRR
ncbi:MAG: hypothetical protein LQ346_003455 [Caloplaca aetnensis]|nr:MAG: hypothetical protein LQ346_003455 [Caloplaca aetnensis]